LREKGVLIEERDNSLQITKQKDKSLRYPEMGGQTTRHKKGVRPSPSEGAATGQICDKQDLLDRGVKSDSLEFVCT
jgi:hypothetical protein